MNLDDAPPPKRNYGRIIQGLLLSVLLGVLAVPLVWFGGRTGRSDRMTGVAIGVIVNSVFWVAVLAAN